MKLCAVSESFGAPRIRRGCESFGRNRPSRLEIGTGNWNTGNHVNLQSLLESAEERRKFLSVFERNGLALSALNCNGNQLPPVDGERQSKVVYDTLKAPSSSESRQSS
jgi:sugar phosphate isomerase/epimerase